MTGRCVTFVGKGQVEVQRVETPDPGPGQVLVRAEATLISPGTERACLLQLPNTKARPPYVGGDCWVGTVEQVGAAVTSLTVGQRVYSQLRHREFQVTEPDYVFPVPDNVPAEDAAFATLIHTSLQAVRKGRVEIGNSVLVLGLGLIGLLAGRLAKLNGALPVLGADISAARRDIARLSCDDVLDPGAPDFGARLATLTCGTGPEVVIEATGFPDAIKTAFEMAARMGRVVLLGSARGETGGINFYSLVHKRGLSIYGAHITAEPEQETQPHLWPRRREEPLALQLLARKRLIVADLISDRCPVEGAPKAYERLARWDERLMGIILDWRS
jgi:L-iditol 2-dehydrogenase